MRKKRKLKTWVIVLFITICLCGILYSCFNLFIWKKNVDSNQEIKKKIDSFISVTEEKEEYIVDFNALKEINSDAVAYIKVNGTNIDYVVVRGTDNSYYLNHNFNNEYNTAGWIFIDYQNKLDGNDKNIVIYGHNAKDGSMFGTLKNILKKTWQETLENQKIVFVTEEGTFMYQVFSIYSIVPEDYYIKTEFQEDAEFETFIQKLRDRSVYDYKVEVNSNDSILTLSSCTTDGKKRVVLHAKKIL